MADLGGARSCATADTRLWTWTPRAGGGAGPSRTEPTWGHRAPSRRGGIARRADVGPSRAGSEYNVEFDLRGRGGREFPPRMREL